MASEMPTIYLREKTGRLVAVIDGLERESRDGFIPTDSPRIVQAAELLQAMLDEIEKWRTK